MEFGEHKVEIPARETDLTVVYIIDSAVVEDYISTITTKKYTSMMIHVCYSRSRFLSCMYIHDKFMTESR